MTNQPFDLLSWVGEEIDRANVLHDYAVKCNEDGPVKFWAGQAEMGETVLRKLEQHGPLYTREQLQEPIEAAFAVLNDPSVPHTQARVSAKLKLRIALAALEQAGNGVGAGGGVAGFGVSSARSTCEPASADSATTSKEGGGDASDLPEPGSSSAPGESIARPGLEGSTCNDLKDLQVGESGPLQAFEGEWSYTFVARDLDHASAQWDKLDRCAESLGFNGEGGAVHHLKPEELIPGSPTQQQLEKGESGPRCEGSREVRQNEGKYQLGPADTLDCPGCPDCSPSSGEVEHRTELKADGTCMGMLDTPDYQPLCSCGWRGRWTSSNALARFVAWRHRRRPQHHKNGEADG